MIPDPLLPRGLPDADRAGHAGKGYGPHRGRKVVRPRQ